VPCARSGWPACHVNRPVLYRKVVFQQYVDEVSKSITVILIIN